MFEEPIARFLVFAWGALYLLLHAGPMLRLWYEPSIRGGTRWPFFASEALLFACWLLFAPAVFGSWLGRAAVTVHVLTHLGYALLDALAHERLLSMALVRRERPLLWAAKELGLLLDTATHATVVWLVARTMPPAQLVAASVLALAAFAWATRGYLRRYGGGALRPV